MKKFDIDIVDIIYKKFNSQTPKEHIMSLYEEKFYNTLNDKQKNEYLNCIRELSLDNSINQRELIKYVLEFVARVNCIPIEKNIIFD